MATISDAFGTITFLDQKWYLQNQTLIDTALKDIVQIKTIHDYYGIKYVGKDIHNQFEFAANGHGTFLATLESGINLKWWHKPQWWYRKTTAMHQLYLKILKDQPQIEFKFIDHEKNHKILCQKTIILTATNHKLALNIVAEKNFDYTLSNLSKCGIYESYQATSETIKPFMKKYNLPEDQTASVIQIIKNDPYLQGYIEGSIENTYQRIVDKLNE